MTERSPGPGPIMVCKGRCVFLLQNVSCALEDTPNHACNLTMRVELPNLNRTSQSGTGVVLLVDLHVLRIALYCKRRRDHCSTEKIVQARNPIASRQTAEGVGANSERETNKKKLTPFPGLRRWTRVLLITRAPPKAT